MAPCSSEHLTVLELDNLPLITDASLDHLVACHNLQRIELYDCQLITRAGIRRLRNHLPNIRYYGHYAITIFSKEQVFFFFHKQRVN